MSFAGIKLVVPSFEISAIYIFSFKSGIINGECVVKKINALLFILIKFSFK